MSPRPLRYVMVEEWTGSIGSAGATFKYNAGNREKTALNVLLGGCRCHRSAQAPGLNLGLVLNSAPACCPRAPHGPRHRSEPRGGQRPAQAFGD